MRLSRPKSVVRPVRLLAAIGLCLVLPLTAAGPAKAANSFGEDMFGISVGGALQGEDTATLARDLDAIAAVGSQWIRIDINWAQVQAGGPNSYNWTAIDRLVQGATARGMKVLGVIEYTPSWARPSGTSATYGPDPATYATFARKAAEHYAPMGVHAYEIWNEPNISAFWTPKPNPAHYANLLKAAYPAIKSADPQATVLTGGTAPAATNGTNYWPTDWLSAIYDNGAGGYFDAVSHHPYCFPATPGDPENWSAWYLMYGSQGRFSGGGGEWGGPSMRSVMQAHGDGSKKIWGTEFGAPTNGPNGVTETEQALAITKGYTLWKSYDWAGPLFTYQGRDYGTDPSDRENFFGLLRHDFSEKPAYAAYRTAFEHVGDPVEIEPENGSTETTTTGGETAGTTTTIAPPKGRHNRQPRRVKVNARVRGARGGTGQIEVQVRRDGQWVSFGSKGAEVRSNGRFSVVLSLTPGVRYRARARYMGSPSAAPSASRYRSFTPSA